MTDKPYRFEVNTRTDKELRFERCLEDAIGQSDLSDIEKAMSFPLFCSRQELTRYLTRYEIYKKTIGVHGSIFECGVLFGSGALLWHHLCSIFEPMNHSKRIIACDTYAGFLSPSLADATGDSAECHTGGFCVDSYAEIERLASIHDMNRPIGHIPRIELVRGDACVTIPAYVKAHPELIVSLLVLDFDVEAPTKVALDSLLPLMPKGAIIAWDELGLKQWPGESKATKDVFGTLNKLRIQRFPWGSTMCYAEVQ